MIPMQRVYQGWGCAGRPFDERLTIRGTWGEGFLEPLAWSVVWTSKGSCWGRRTLSGYACSVADFGACEEPWEPSQRQVRDRPGNNHQPDPQQKPCARSMTGRLDWGHCLYAQSGCQIGREQ